ncbi:MAG: PIN domain protein [Syntrophorhabdus sp. PtaU1.Bin050]|nr:MAG: PIN domain protein [Syntrophorhabdus sp. PtaU1.Bin050]
MDILVDSNIILDIVTEDKRWFGWSSKTLTRLSAANMFVVNPIIYSEVSVGFEKIEDLEDVLDPRLFRRDQIPWEAAFLAGKCFLQYRRQGGKRDAPLPDFFIGAHAAVSKMQLLTRDEVRYRTYFPTITIISPKTIRDRGV